MRTYLSSIIPQLKQHSEKLDNLALLTNQHWVVLNEELDQVKCVYIFRTNQELLIARNGKIEKARWEYLGQNALMLELSEGSFLFKHGFFDANVLALKVDNREEYAFLINESRYVQELNSVARVQDFLRRVYLDKTMDPKLQQWVGGESHVANEELPVAVDGGLQQEDPGELNYFNLVATMVIGILLLIAFLLYIYYNHPAAN